MGVYQPQILHEESSGEKSRVSGGRVIWPHDSLAGEHAIQTGADSPIDLGSKLAASTHTLAIVVDGKERASGWERGAAGGCG